jgi:hypothetical protein
VIDALAASHPVGPRTASLRRPAAAIAGGRDWARQSADLVPGR